MCEQCTDSKELQVMLYEEWRKQENIPENAVISDSVQTSFLGNSDGVLILQKSYDRSIMLFDEGAKMLPDTAVNAIHVPEDGVEDFIGELLAAAGPKVFMRLLANGMTLLNPEAGEEDE